MSTSASCVQYSVVCDAYGGEAGTLAKLGTTTQSDHQPAVHSGGSLPFTGLDVGLLVVCAAALVAVGAILRRTSNPSVPREH